MEIRSQKRKISQCLSMLIQLPIAQGSRASADVGRGSPVAVLRCTGNGVGRTGAGVGLGRRHC